MSRYDTNKFILINGVQHITSQLYPAGIRWPIWVIAALCIFDPGLGAWKFYRCSVSLRVTKSQSLKPKCVFVCVCVFSFVVVVVVVVEPQASTGYSPDTQPVQNLEISLMGARCSSLLYIAIDLDGWLFELF